MLIIKTLHKKLSVSSIISKTVFGSCMIFLYLCSVNLNILYVHTQTNEKKSHGDENQPIIIHYVLRNGIIKC